MIQSMSAYSRSSTSPASATPALLTTTLTRPKCSATASAYAANAARSATSSRSLRTSRAPAGLDQRRRSRPGPARRRRRSRAARRGGPGRAASARPMPEPAPVITTTLSSSVFMRWSSCDALRGRGCAAVYVVRLGVEAGQRAGGSVNVDARPQGGVPAVGVEVPAGSSRRWSTRCASSAAAGSAFQPPLGIRARLERARTALRRIVRSASRM